MIVDFKKATDIKNFGKLENGVVFGYAGDFFIKMAYDIGEEGDFFNAVNIEDGYPAFFENEDGVTEYPKAKTVIE